MAKISLSTPNCVCFNDSHLRFELMVLLRMSELSLWIIMFLGEVERQDRAKRHGSWIAPELSFVSLHVSFLSKKHCLKGQFENY